MTFKGVISPMLFVFNRAFAVCSEKQLKLSVKAFLFISVGLLAWSANPVLATSIYAEDFSGFEGFGFSVNPAVGQLDSDLFRVTGLSDGDGVFGGSYTSDDFSRGGSFGGEATAGIYAFDVSNGGLTPNTALGVQSAGNDLTPGSISLRLVNQSSRVINFLEIQFDIFELNDKDRSSSVNFAYALGNENLYNSLLFYTSTEDGSSSASWLGTELSTSLLSLNWLPSDKLFLRWSFDDVSGSGSRDELAIDNIRVDEMTAVPEPAVLPIFLFGILMIVARIYSRDPMRFIRI